MLVFTKSPIPFHRRLLIGLALHYYCWFIINNALLQHYSTFSISILKQTVYLREAILFCLNSDSCSTGWNIQHSSPILSDEIFSHLADALIHWVLLFKSSYCDWWKVFGKTKRRTYIVRGGQLLDNVPARLRTVLSLTYKVQGFCQLLWFLWIQVEWLDMKGFQLSLLYCICLTLCDSSKALKSNPKVDTNSRRKTKHVSNAAWKRLTQLLSFIKLPDILGSSCLEKEAHICINPEKGVYLPLQVCQQTSQLTTYITIWDGFRFEVKNMK